MMNSILVFVTSVNTGLTVPAYAQAMEMQNVGDAPIAAAGVGPGDGSRMSQASGSQQRQHGQHYRNLNRIP